MTSNINTIAPDFVLVTYDIAATAGSTRQYILRKLRQNAFISWTQSVYYGRFSEPLMNEVINFAKNRRDIHLTVTTPAFPSDQGDMLRNRYEQHFIAQFGELKSKLVQTEIMLAEDEPYDTPETRKTPKQIKQRLRDLEYILRDLEHALAKRKERDTNLTEEERKSLVEVEASLRWKQAMIDRLNESVDKRIKQLSDNPDKKEETPNAP